MWNWLREFYEIRQEVRDRRSYCQSCETLRVELNNARREKQILLDKIINPTPETFQQLAPEPQPILTRHKPWRVRQAELEAEDRVKAEQIKRDFTDRLEKSIGVKKDGEETIRRDGTVPGSSATG